MKNNHEFRKDNQSSPKRKLSVVTLNRQTVILILFTALVIFFTVVIATAQDDSEPVISENTVELLSDSKEDELTNERARLSDLMARLQRMKVWQDELQVKVSLYEAQESVHQNLLLKANTDRDEIESAIQTNRSASKSLKDSLDTFQGTWEKGSVLLQQIEDRMALGDKQLDEIQNLNVGGVEKQKLIDLHQEFSRVLREEKEIIASYAILYQNILVQLNDSISAVEETGQRLTDQLSRQAKILLFKRTFEFHTFISMPLRSELQKVTDRLTTLFSPTGRKALWIQIKQDSGLHLLIFLVLLSLILAGQGKLRKYLEHFEQKLTLPDWRYSKLAVQLLLRSLVPASLALFFTLSAAFKWTLLNIGLTRVLAYLFYTLLFTRWGLDYLKLGLNGSPTALRNSVVPRLQRLIRLVRLAMIVLIFTNWIAGTGSSLSWLPWLVFIIYLLGWTVAFWHAVPAIVAEGAREGQAVVDPKRLKILRGLSFLVSGGALLIYVVGYYFLAKYWIANWIYTTIIILWGWISYQVIQELRRAHQALADSRDEAHPLRSRHQLRWALIQIAGLTWYVAFAWILIRVWDRTGYVMLKLAQLFNLTVNIGTLNISLKGVVLAGLIIFLTHLINRVGRSLLDEKVLGNYTLERGLRNSILTIDSYLTWGLGLLLAMGTLGVNATSLAVVFGAVSIGIGFGLQNIFNNFISGLILLFERPIQVGDTVEVNGLWAEVKKINVRSTVVQTFDNASVIIPNSDFISQQVTNWSFKDTRMRKNINVGVAYGSDIDLVRKTLLEIAAEIPNVLKYPRPEVIFVDHGDSALIFRLRIWTHVDNYWAVPSAIRFELDKRFRDLSIEIAFPQRDVHIRSITKTEATDQQMSNASG